MTHVTCKLTAKNRDQLRNPTLGNRVWAISYLYLCKLIIQFTGAIGLLDGSRPTRYAAAITDPNPNTNTNYNPICNPNPNSTKPANLRDPNCP